MKKCAALIHFALFHHECVRNMDDYNNVIQKAVAMKSYCCNHQVARKRSTVYFIKYCPVDRYSHTTLLFALSVSQNSVSTFVGVWASVCLGARATSRRRHPPTEGVPCRHAIGGRLASDRRSAELPGVSDRSTTMGTVVRHGLNIHLYMSIFSQIQLTYEHSVTLFITYVCELCFQTPSELIKVIFQTPSGCTK